MIPALSLIVALTSVLTGALIQWQGQLSKKEMKKFEVTFIEKQKAYSRFMSALISMNYECLTGDVNESMFDSIDLQEKYFFIEPFLSDSTYEVVWNEVHNAILTCTNKTRNIRSGNFDLSVNDLTIKQNRIRKLLRSELFGLKVQI